MKKSKETDSIMIFAGTTWEAGEVKSLLETAEIEAFLKDEKTENLKPWMEAPGGMETVKVFVSAPNVKKACKIVDGFKKNPNLNGE